MFGRKQPRSLAFLYYAAMALLRARIVILSTHTQTRTHARHDLRANVVRAFMARVYVVCACVRNSNMVG